MPRAGRRVADVVGLPRRVDGVDLAAGREGVPGGLGGRIVARRGIEDDVGRHLAAVAGAVEEAPVEVIERAAEGGLAETRATVEMSQVVRILLDVDDAREVDLRQGRTPGEQVSVRDCNRGFRVDVHAFKFWNAPSAPPH